jgi:DNA repair exonuclease SbcCD ATPase subunit
MVEENPPEFKFSADDSDPETFYQEELKDLRVEKLSQKVTLLSILLPILIGIAIFFAYRDLTGRVSQTQDTGSMEVQRISRRLEEISKEFNDKLITFTTTLSTQDQAFDSTVSGKLAAVNKNVAALNKNLKSLNDNLNQTRSTVKNLNAAKADKKSQKAAFAKVNIALKSRDQELKSLDRELKSLAKLRGEFKTVSSEIKNLESNLDQKMGEAVSTAEQSRKELKALQTSIADLAGQKVDLDTFELEVFKLRKNYQNRVAQEITAINQKLGAIQKQIDNIKKISKSSKRSMKSLSKKPSTATPAGAMKTTTPSKSGSINEQDLLE